MDVLSSEEIAGQRAQHPDAHGRCPQCAWTRHPCSTLEVLDSHEALRAAHAQALAALADAGDTVHCLQADLADAEAARDQALAAAARLRAALTQIAADPGAEADGRYDEWTEAQAFYQAQALARQALREPGAAG